MLYRVLRPLSTGDKPGDIVDGGKFKHLDVLIAAGALAEVKTPPLSELPGWKLRAEKLARIGVVTVQDFLEADPGRVKALFGYKRMTAVNKWREEAEAWLRPEKYKFDKKR